MSRGFSRFFLSLTCAVIAFSSSGCGLNGSSSPSPSQTVPAQTETPTVEMASLTPEPPSPAVLATLPGTLLATATPALVTVTASTGNMFIRRGPDLAFNAISVLRRGQSAKANARDVLARWLRIDAPGSAQGAGWISIVSAYTNVSGDVNRLPEIEPTDWPVLASLRNCTYDQMVAEPGGIPIPPVDAFPANDVRINPGAYTIHDSDVDGYPEVLTVNIREGSAVDIRVDGNGQKRKCPIP